MKEWNLYLDMDGVLADFDKRAKAILGMPPGEFEEKYGSKEYWHRLQSTDDFYFSFDKMDDADILFAAVKHLDPIVLTGVPRGFQAQTQASRGASRHRPRRCAGSRSTSGQRCRSSPAEQSRSHGSVVLVT